MNNTSQLGITVLSQIPIREKAAHSSQMVSQLLFGETYEVLENVNKEWLRIKCSYDDYEGFIASNQFLELNALPNESFIQQQKIACYTLSENSGITSMGSSFPNRINDTYSIGDQKGKVDVLNETDVSLTISKLIEINSKVWLNVPYLWGGRTVFGVDCSGFTQVIFKTANIVLPRDAYQQAEIGEDVYFVGEAKCGDLAFFDNDGGKINHVGIVLDNGKIIHSSGFVRIDTLDHKGIYNVNKNEYSHNLRLIKRVI